MTVYAEPRLLPCGDRAISVELADEIGREVNARVLALDYLIRADGVPGHRRDRAELSRAARRITTRSAMGYADLRARLTTLAAKARPDVLPPARTVELPCCYDEAPRLRAGGGRRAPRAHRRGGRALHAGGRLLRRLHRLHARPALSLGLPDPLAHPPPRATAAQDAAGQRQHRRHAVLHLLGGEPRRVLGARADAGAALRSRGGGPDPPARRRPRALPRDRSRRVRRDHGRGGGGELPARHRGGRPCPAGPTRHSLRDVLARYQRRRVASSAPRASARSFAHTTLSATISEPANVPKPQSVDAMTRSGRPPRRRPGRSGRRRPRGARRSWSSCR